MRLLLFIAVLFSITGCSDAKNTDAPVGITKKNEYGIVYVVTCIEDQKFIATQGSYNVWSYAGPLGDCDINLTQRK